MSAAARNGQLLNESSILSSSSSLSNGGFRDARKRNCWHQCWAWARDGFTIIACCYGIITAAITVALAFQIRFGTPQVPPAGAVASDDGKCSKDAGLAMLREGGSAVDAAVASLLCLSVTHPHLVGPGGGGLMLVHDHVQNKTRVIDFLPDIPTNFDPARRTSFIGGESVGVPGFLHGLHRAHQRYGKLPWEALFHPAIDAAKEGFRVSASLEDALVPLNSALIPSPPPRFPGPEGALKSSGGGATSNSFSATFVPFGVRLKRGTIVTRPPYAHLLEKVAQFGPAVVFELDYAVEVVELLKESGSSITVADLHSYQVREYDAVWSSYSNKTVFTTPGAGDILLAVLRLLANTGVDSTTPLQELYEHVVQVLKLAQPIYFKMARELEQRAPVRAAFRNASESLNLYHVYQDFSEKSRQLLDDEHGALQQQQKSSSLTVLQKLMGGVDAAALRRLPPHAATQVSAVDTYDLYVTAVAGLGSLFGSQLMTTHGVLFNNMLASVPLSANASQHAQRGSVSSGRPLVPYAPFILVDDLKVCGQRVVCSSSNVGDSVQVLAHHLLRQLPLTPAVAQPRVALDTSNDLVLLDDLSHGLRLPGSVRNFLISRGYQLGMNRPPYSSVNSVAKVKDDTSSHSDPRGGGLAARLSSGGIDYQKGSSFSDSGSEQTTGAARAEMTVAAGSDVEAADGLAAVAALNISNPGSEVFENAGGSDNIAAEGSAYAIPQFAQEGSRIYENAPTSPDFTADGIKKKIKESTTVRSSSINKKYIGDAGAFDQGDNPSQGTGRVVKGDARGGVRLVYHESEEKLKGSSSDYGTDGRVNGGRGGNSSFELFKTEQSGVTSTRPSEEPPLPAAPPVDSVFSDYDPLRHLSQVRVDNYQAGEEEERPFVEPDADYVQAPINIWGHPETRLAPAHVAVLPGHPASQFRKQIQKQQLADQRRQKLATHLQQQQNGQIAFPLPAVFGPGQPGSGLPVIVQRHRDHSHPILGSEVSGPYEDISG